jgi:transcriptional regulator with XRE-family HTH domain
MFVARDAKEFFVLWRKREGFSQHKMARLLGFSFGYIGDIETGRKKPSLRFALRFMGLLKDHEKLAFMDTFHQWYEEAYPKEDTKRRIELVKKLRETKKLHEISADDLAVAKANGFEVDGETKDLFREKYTRRRRRTREE